MARVLVVHPDFSRLGGIESYLGKILPQLNVAYTSCGNSRRPGERGLTRRVARIAGDYLRYWRQLRAPGVTVVHLNPSLQARMFYRDFVYLWLARLHGKKTLVFFHGWDAAFARRLRRGLLFRLLYGRADAFVVLAESFARQLRSWGIRQSVHREVIVIEDGVYDAIDLEVLLRRRRQARQKTLLFPARIMRSKGILTTLEALAALQARHADTGLIVAGDGEDLDESRRLAEQLGLVNCRFTGRVGGADLYALYAEAWALCFPTEHDEGFPNTIVEAMAFGLPIVTRPVGGIGDFFVDGRHGYITESTRAADFAERLEKLLADDATYTAMARANHDYAGQHFLASRAAQRLEAIYRSL